MAEGLGPEIHIILCDAIFQEVEWPALGYNSDVWPLLYMRILSIGLCCIMNPSAGLWEGRKSVKISIGVKRAAAYHHDFFLFLMAIRSEHSSMIAVTGTAAFSQTLCMEAGARVEV